MEHLATTRKLLSNCTTYKPVVFSVQGGTQRNAGSIVFKLEKAVAKAQGINETSSRADIVNDLSLILARSAANSAARQVLRVDTAGSEQSLRMSTQMDMNHLAYSNELGMPILHIILLLLFTFSEQLLVTCLYPAYCVQPLRSLRLLMRKNRL